jgi:hypothetical protein
VTGTQTRHEVLVAILAGNEALILNHNIMPKAPPISDANKTPATARTADFDVPAGRARPLVMPPVEFATPV